MGDLIFIVAKKELLIKKYPTKTQRTLIEYIFFSILSGFAGNKL
jgi:hypothetical protein